LLRGTKKDYHHELIQRLLLVKKEDISRCIDVYILGKLLNPKAPTIWVGITPYPSSTINGFLRKEFYQMGWEEENVLFYSSLYEYLRKKNLISLHKSLKRKRDKRSHDTSTFARFPYSYTCQQKQIHQQYDRGQLVERELGNSVRKTQSPSITSWLIKAEDFNVLTFLGGVRDFYSNYIISIPFLQKTDS